MHWNSGIANLAFYRAVAGGKHPRGKTSNVVPALAADPKESIQKGAAIFYRANTAYLGASATFADARTATAQAAADLYGANSPEVTSINEAWTAVGVGAAPTWLVLKTETGVSAQKGKAKSFNYATPAGATQIKFRDLGRHRRRRPLREVRLRAHHHEVRLQALRERQHRGVLLQPGQGRHLLRDGPRLLVLLRPHPQGELRPVALPAPLPRSRGALPAPALPPTPSPPIMTNRARPSRFPAAARAGDERRDLDMRARV